MTSHAASEVRTARAVVPSLLGVLGGRILVVDRVQPFAVLLEPDGTVVSLVSWVDVVPQPAAVPVWPPRQLHTDGVTAWVEERGEGVIVALHHDDGELRATSASGPSTRSCVTRTQLAQTFDLVAGDRTWGWSSEREGFTRRVRAERVEDGVALEIGVGAAVAGVAVETAMVVAVRVAHQRPWSPAPPHRLIRVDAVTTESTDLDLPALPEARWPARTEVPPDVLADHLRATAGDCAVLRDAGATDVSFVVAEPTTRPTITTTFRLPGRDVAFERRDEVVDELGRPTGGLAGAGVFLEEDLAAGLVDKVLADGRGPQV